MKYYIVSAEMAEKIGVKGFRTGNEKDGYLVNTSDIAIIGVQNAVLQGAREVTAWEAKKFIDNVNKKR